MSKTVKWIAGLVVVVFVLVWGYLAFKGPSLPASNEPIKIGFIGPLTGDAASYGISEQNSVKMAVDEINLQGGIKGHQLQVVYEDGQCGNMAATAAQKLVNIDQVKIILGGFCSGESLSALPITKSKKVILFSSGSSNPTLTGASKYFARNYPSDALPGKRIAEFMIEKGHKTSGIITETSDAAVGLRKVFIDRFVELGGKVVADESFVTGTKDFRTTLTKIKEANPSALYVIGQTPASDELIIKQMNEVRLKTQIFGGFEMLGGDKILKNIPTLLEGSLYMEPALDENSTTTKGFTDKYLSLYKNFGGLPEIYSATTYDAVYLLKEMIEKYGLDTDKISEGLRQVKDWKGVEGSLTINENGDPEFQYVIRVIHNGKVETLR